MTIKVKFFALARDLAGTAEAEIDVPRNSTAAAALVRVVEAFPSLSKIHARLALAVNLAYVRQDHLLIEGDELALIPPVSGG